MCSLILRYDDRSEFGNRFSSCIPKHILQHIGLTVAWNFLSDFPSVHYALLRRTLGVIVYKEILQLLTELHLIYLLFSRLSRSYWYTICLRCSWAISAHKICYFWICVTCMAFISHHIPCVFHIFHRYIVFTCLIFI